MNQPAPARKAILVTGAAGFLGGNLCRHFSRLGWKVAGLDIAPLDTLAQKDIGVSVWMTGTANMETAQRLYETAGPFDVIFHAAGPGAVGPSFTAPLADFEATAAACAQILELIRTRSPATVFAFPSSAAVYGAVGREKISEDSPKNPVSPYGFHKLMAELLCQSYSANFGLKTVAIRFFSIYGPGLRKQLLWDLAAKTRVNPALTRLSGTGEETRDLIYIEDAVRLVQLAVERAGEGSFTPLNGASGQPITVKHIAQTLLDAMGYKGALEFDGAGRKGDPAHYQADISRARAIGFSPAWSHADGMAAFAGWAARELGAGGKA